MNLEGGDPVSPGGARGLRDWRSATWVAIFALACIVRVWRLDHFSYWLDEILQSFFIHGSWQSFWASLRFDAVHPPLDYLLDRLFDALNPSDAARKLLPAAWGVGTVLAVGVLVSKRAGRNSGLAAGLILAVAPFHVRYSQELRPYSLGMFLLCLSALALENFLERPRLLRLAALYLACLLAAYALYAAGLLVALVCGAMTVEDSFSRDPGRRRSARKFAAWSPLFALLLWAAYLPWWPVALEAVRRPPTSPPIAFGLARVTRMVSYFGFRYTDWAPLGFGGIFYAALLLAGLAVAASRGRHRFLAAWAILGFGVIEILEEARPHFDSAQHYLVAGLTFPVLVALLIARLLERVSTRWIGALLLAGVVLGEVGGLRGYFRDGRADWRLLARYLQRLPSSDRVYVENQYTQLCLSYYVSGPYWLHTGTLSGHDMLNLEGRTDPLRWWAAAPRGDAWVVLAAGPAYPEVRKFVESAPGFSFPTAEGNGGATLKWLRREHSR